jgi:hypothetical protein
VAAFRFFDTTGVPDAGGVTDAVFLAPPVPNPVTGRMSFAVRLAGPGRAVVRVFDSSGRLISTVLDEVLPAGGCPASFNIDDAGGRRVPPGIYHPRLDAAGTSRTRRFTVVR